MAEPAFAAARPLPAGLAGHPALWRGRHRGHRAAAMSTGLPRLDALLPDGGWPLGDTVELLTARPGLGEFGLLLPALSRVTAGGGWAVLINPPWLPYPPALRGHGVDLGRVLLVRTPQPADALWACEQSLCGLRGGVVLTWPPPEVRFPQLRRLQLAARGGRQAVFLFRDAAAAGHAAPASLRLHLDSDAGGLRLTLLKGRGARPGTTVRLHRPGTDGRAWPEHACPGFEEPLTHPGQASSGSPGPTRRADTPVPGAGIHLRGDFKSLGAAKVNVGEGHQQP